MSATLISIIIPVYKVERYLNKCLTSIVNQSYQNFEVILVDDGSPDRCPQICDEWAHKDSRFHVIHQVNKGVSAARNAALEIINGDFFTCIDGDDYVCSNFLEDFIFALKNKCADIFFCGYKKYFSDGREKEFNNSYEELDIITLEKKAWGDWGYSNAAWAKLFKTAIVREKKITYNTKLTNSEDVLFLKDYLQFVKKSVHIGKSNYIYFIRESGSIKNISRSTFSTARLAVWNTIKDSYSKGYTPWNNFVLLTAADIQIDAFRHPTAKIDELPNVQLFIVRHRLAFLFHGSKPLKSKVKLLFKLYFPKLIAKIK